MNNVQPSGNYFNKYQSRNILHQRLMKGFIFALDSLLDEIDYSSVLDAGCGEGYICEHIYQAGVLTGNSKFIVGTDISEEVIDTAKRNNPSILFKTNSIYQMDEKNNSFDLVIAMEVLEHLQNPNAALDELFRITSKYVLLSVPNEPIWRVANFIRGKYLRQGGNTPGHIQHWTKNQFINIIKDHGDLIALRTPFPWTMVLFKKLDN